jgi:hypothetical protein
MSHKLYLLVSGAVFFLVAVFHLVRLAYHWPILVGTWTIPYVVSYMGFPVSSAYCVWACWLYIRQPERDPLERP